MNVIFVNMPFSAIRPAIGVSLLKSHLAQMKVPARVEYFNLRFAQLVGDRAYRNIAEFAPTRSLMGEYVFSHCLSRGRATDITEYFTMLEESRLIGRTSHVKGRLDGQREASWWFERLGSACAMAEPFLQECLERVDWRSYDVVGFTTTFSQNVASLALAERLKDRYPHLLMVFGGANCEAGMGLQLHRSFPFIDLVCSGEADVTFPRLIRCLTEDGDAATIPGVICRRDGVSRYTSLRPEPVADLDTLPYPDYDDFLEQYEPLRLGSAEVQVPAETSRGCWWGEKQHCTFCGLNGLSMTFRSKSPGRALDEICALAERYQTSSIFMVDNILNLHYLRDVLPELKRRRLNLNLFYETKANLSKEQLQLFRDAGITEIQPGIENFSSNVLRLMRKGTSALQNVQVLKWCKELGLTSHWNLLYGFPGEDPEEYERMAALLPALHHLDPPGGCGRIRLDRFSPYFVEAERFGLCNVRPTQAYRFIYDLSESELANLAYYFDYDYADGHDPESYTERTRDEVGRWLAGFGGDDEPSLTYQDDGAILVIRDSRAALAPGVTRLVGEEREIYLYCDQNRSLQQVRTFARSLGRADGNADVLLRRLVDRRLMVEADGRYLSLAVSADGGPASPCRTGAAFGSITPNAVVASTPGRRRKQYERERGQHKERNTRGVHRQASGIS